MQYPSQLLRAAILLFGCMVATPACVSDSSDDVVIVTPAPTGLLTVEFTIEGTTNPTLCDFYGATHLELVLYDVYGGSFSDYAPCKDFVISVETDVGYYTGEVVLLDYNLAPVSVSLILDDLRVVEGTELVVAVDFPLDAML